MLQIVMAACSETKQIRALRFRVDWHDRFRAILNHSFHICMRPTAILHVALIKDF